jgi:hypothetical protein
LLRPDVPINYYWLETTVIAASYSTVGAVVASAKAERPTRTTQLESSLYRRDVSEYVVAVERTLQVSKGLIGVSSVL